MRVQEHSGAEDVASPKPVAKHAAQREAILADLRSRGRSHPYWVAARPSQQERYEKVLQATIDLAREGGYDAVQMRAVADLSGVSLGTVYTYFQSRDNLLYRATIAWNTTVAEQAAGSFGTTDAPGSLEDDVVRAARMYVAEPGLLDAYVRATLSNDPLVVAERKDLDWSWWTEFYPRVAALGPEAAEMAPNLLTDVFYSGVLRWAYGQVELSYVVEQLRRVVQLLTAASRAEAG